MRAAIVVPLVVAGVIALKVVGAFAIVMAFCFAIPVIASLALAGGIVYVLVMSMVFVVRFIVYCARGFRGAEPKVLTAQAVDPPAAQRRSYAGDYRTVYGYPRRRNPFWSVLIFLGGIAFIAMVIHSARHRDRSVSWAFNRQSHTMTRQAQETDDDSAEAEEDLAEGRREWAEGRRQWAEAQRKLENLPKYIQEKVSKELRAVEKSKQHGWHWATPIPPMPPAPPDHNEHPETLTEKTVQDSKLLEDWEIKDKTGATREQAIQKALTEAQEKLVQFLREQSPPIALKPSRDYIREHLVTNIEDKQVDTGMGISPAVNMKLEIHGNQVVEMRQLDHQVRVNGRLLSIGRLLAMVVAALAAISGYIRVDLWSNRSYTNLLRLGLTALLVLVSVGMWYLPL